ncbi:MAG TPA: L-threonylcarbamoyladenylate synthase [Kofleriaceae bacterium]
MALLVAGELVAFPTETVYGLGADASRADAVAKIFAAKGRPSAHPLIVHLAPGASLDGWAANVPDAALALVAKFWPGPLTIVVAKGPRVDPAATGGGNTVGLRVPAHPLAQQLLAKFGRGVAAPSANRFGAVSPTTAEHVQADLDVYVLDGGPCTVGVESTIVDFTRGQPALLRPGGVSREAIEAMIGTLAVAGDDAPAAPGTLASHYAPRAEVIAVAIDDVPAALDAVYEREDPIISQDRETTAVIGKPLHVAVLAPRAAFAAWGALPAQAIPLPDDLDALAAALYGALRDLDAAGVDVVIAALPPAVGLGEAVADRLRRAAGPRTHA